MATESDSPLNSIPITELTTPQFVAIIINWGLFGALSVQVYSYFQAFHNDRSTLKVLVYGVYILELAQTLLLTDTVWNALGKGFGEVKELNETGTTWMSIFLIGGLVALLVQCFYAYRILIISENKILTGLLLFLSLCSFSGALATSIKAKATGEYSNVVKLIGTMALWIGVGSSVDVIIVMCMWYFLRRQIRYTPFAMTHAIVSKIILLTIETGALTASISIISLVLFFSTPTFFEAPISSMAKIYSTTLLAVLNSRATSGTIPQPTTWMEHELRFLDQGIKVVISAASSSESSTSSQHADCGVLVAKEVITRTESESREKMV